MFGAPNWKALFTGHPKSSSPLVFSIPSRVDGKMIINPPAEVVAEGVGIWEGCIVGQFLHKRLPLHVVRSLVDRLWGKHEMPEITTTDNGLYIFRFKDLDAQDWVMENGPWFFAGRPIILRIWKPGMEMLNVQLTSLPILVKFLNIPLEYWTVTSLAHIASAVGIPLHLDTLTKNHSRLSFARICIEVDLNCEFPRSALLDLGNGEFSTIRIEYPWVPQNFSHCKIFGHSRLKCHVVKESYHNGIGPSNGYVDTAGSVPINGSDSVFDGIGDLINTPVKAGSDKYIKVNVVDNPIRLSGNTFECLALSDDSSPLAIAVDRASSSYGSPTITVVSDPYLTSISSHPNGPGSLDSSKPSLPSITEFSDSSLNCETFKHIKRI